MSNSNYDYEPSGLVVENTALEDLLSEREPEEEEWSSSGQEKEKEPVADEEEEEGTVALLPSCIALLRALAVQSDQLYTSSLAAAAACIWSFHSAS